MSERHTKAGNQAHSLSHTHFLTHSFTLSRHAEQLLFLCLCSKVTLTLFHFHYFRRFHYFHNFHPLIQSLSTCWTSFVFISMLKTHCLLLKIAMVFFGPHPHHPILTLSHSHTLSFSHSLILDMLNKFCFHLYAQNSLFRGENCNVFFDSSTITLTCEFRVHRAGSQLKI